MNRIDELERVRLRRAAQDLPFVAPDAARAHALERELVNRAMALAPPSRARSKAAIAATAAIVLLVGGTIAVVSVRVVRSDLAPAPITGVAPIASRPIDTPLETALSAGELACFDDPITVLLEPLQPLEGVEPAQPKKVLPRIAKSAARIEAPHAPEQTPPSLEERFVAARTALDAGDSARAIELFDRLIESAPNDPLAEDAAYGRAVALLRAHRFGEAKAALIAYRDRYPTSPHANEVARTLERLATY